MIVKCPQCSTGYSIPENLITDKPKKMRCSRCKNVFTLMRRHDKAPSGYEEFTGSQHLPQEFAFLKTAPPDESPPLAAAPATEQPATAPDTAAEPRTDGEGPPGPEVAPTSAASAPPAPSSPPPVSAGYYTGRQGFAPAPEAWEAEMPLELSGYTIPVETRSRGAQAFGKFIFVLIVIGVLLFGFVLFRNDWSLSLEDLGAQITYAFSGEKHEKIPEEAQSVDVVISARKLVTARSGEKYLIVTGEVFNRGFIGLSRIVLRGRLMTGAQERTAEVRAPCGKTIDEATIKMTPKGAMGGHFRTKEGALYNCVISADGSTPFQLIFDDVPPEYRTLEVVPVTAQVAE
jgi:predicted Zn finger-like uncharacterized protein